MSGLQQVFHVFGKDARRYWPLVGFLTALLVADSLMPPDEIRYFGAGIVGSMLGGAGLRGSILTLAMILIAALVVHEDNASDGRSFWTSRPLSPAAVLAAKGLFMAVFLIGLPMIFQALAILEYGTWNGMGALLVESGLRHAGLLATVAAVSAVTRDLKGTLFLGIAGYALLGVLTSALRQAPGTVRFGAGPDLAIDLFILGACMAILAFQYGTRRTREAIAALAVFLVVVPAVVTTQWAPDRRTNFFEVRPLSDDFVAPEMRVQALEYAPGRRSMNGNGMDRIDAVIATGPSELSVIPRMSSLDLRVRTADGGDERSTPRGRLYNPDQRYAPLMDGYRWLGEAGEWAHFDVPVLMAPGRELSRAITSIEQIDLTAEWDAFERQPLGRLAFRVGDVFESGDMRVRVDSVRIENEELHAVLNATWVTSGRRLGSNEPSTGTLRVIAIHDGRKEYLLGSSGSNARNSTTLVLPGPRGVRQAISLRYRLGDLEGSDVTIDEGWFEGASILVYSNEYVGSFTHTMSTDLSEWRMASGMAPVVPEANAGVVRTAAMRGNR